MKFSSLRQSPLFALSLALATCSTSSPTTPTSAMYMGTESGFTQTEVEIGTDQAGPFNCVTQYAFPSSPVAMTIMGSGGSGTITIGDVPYRTTGTGDCRSGLIRGPAILNLQVTVSGGSVTATMTQTLSGAMYGLFRVP
jgi:hypothetical protein